MRTWWFILQSGGEKKNYFAVGHNKAQALHNAEEQLKDDMKSKGLIPFSVKEVHSEAFDV